MSNVLYLCNGKQCENCEEEGGECIYTTDIKYAKNFHRIKGAECAAYEENDRDINLVNVFGVPYAEALRALTIYKETGHSEADYVAGFTAGAAYAEDVIKESITKSIEKYFVEGGEPK